MKFYAGPPLYVEHPKIHSLLLSWRDHEWCWEPKWRGAPIWFGPANGHRWKGKGPARKIRRWQVWFAAEIPANVLARVVCAWRGHEPENDHCGKPDHRFCSVCNRRMENAPVFGYPKGGYVVIDPNVRVENNETYAGFEDVVGELRIPSPTDRFTSVPVVEVESLINGRAKITRVDEKKRLIYMQVDWERLVAPQKGRIVHPKR